MILTISTETNNSLIFAAFFLGQRPCGKFTGNSSNASPSLETDEPGFSAMAHSRFGSEMSHIEGRNGDNRVTFFHRISGALW